MTEATHRCPIGDRGIMPCCGRTPFERLNDRMTVDPDLVTCRDAPAYAYRIGWWTHKWWPRKTLLWCLLIGKQPLPAAATGSRKASRWYYVKTIARRLKMIRRPHRPWQAEITVPGCSCNARRAFTADGAVKRVQALHAKRLATRTAPGIPVGGVEGVCWAALDDRERATCA